MTSVFLMIEIILNSIFYYFTLLPVDVMEDGVFWNFSKRKKKVCQSHQPAKKVNPFKIGTSGDDDLRITSLALSGMQRLHTTSLP